MQEYLSRVAKRFQLSMGRLSVNLHVFHRVAQEVDGRGDDYSVMIVAAGPLRDGGIAHAVVVTQPVTSWTVLRSYDHFKTVGESLTQLLPGLPVFPAASHVDGIDINVIVQSRNDLQLWLDRVLMYPGARESPLVRNFLTYDANMIPPEFEGVSWTNFSPNLNTSSHTEAHQVSDFDDMEMSDMFDPDDDGASEEEVDDTDDFVRASIRYKATDEPITDEDEMDLMAFASEVEMVDDMGSLALSLGASHLGRSLQRQAEIAKLNHARHLPPPADDRKFLGLQLGLPAPQPKSGGVGGLSNVMEMAKQQNKVQGLGDSFFQKRPVSAPKLDSFKMVKVIGKGSFGKLVVERRLDSQHSVSHFLNRQSIPRQRK